MPLAYQSHIPICPRPYSGEDGNTYSNDCVAACAGAEVAYEGECNEGRTYLSCPAFKVGGLRIEGRGLGGLVASHAQG